MPKAKVAYVSLHLNSYFVRQKKNQQQQQNLHNKTNKQIKKHQKENPEVLTTQM